MQTARRVIPKLPRTIHQTSFAQSEFATKKKGTRREKFLARMEAVLPWARLLAVIVPHEVDPEAGCAGGKPGAARAELAT